MTGTQELVKANKCIFRLRESKEELSNEGWEIKVANRTWKGL